MGPGLLQVLERTLLSAFKVQRSRTVTQVNGADRGVLPTNGFHYLIFSATDLACVNKYK
jgi:hypothetical protein